MTFPVMLDLFGLRVHPHLVAEVIAYTGGFQLFLRTRSRFPRAEVPFERMMWVIVGAVFGALFGSKLLAWVESPGHYVAAFGQHRFDVLLGGKTVVGGLLGGWAGVEIAKRLQGIRQSTGDAFVFPLIFGQCVGRVGCFLTGLDDHTHGVHTTLPCAVDFGDGPRHPTQLYEIAFLLMVAIGLWWLRATGGVSARAVPVTEVTGEQAARGTGTEPRSHAGLRNGTLFRLYLLSYLLFRFAVEFVKPIDPRYAGLSAIQVAALLGAAVLLVSLARTRGGAPAPHDTPPEPVAAR